MRCFHSDEQPHLRCPLHHDAPSAAAAFSSTRRRAWRGAPAPCQPQLGAVALAMKGTTGEVNEWPEVGHIRPRPGGRVRRVGAPGTRCVAVPGSSGLWGTIVVGTGAEACGCVTPPLWAPHFAQVRRGGGHPEGAGPVKYFRGSFLACPDRCWRDSMGVGVRLERSSTARNDRGALGAGYARWSNDPERRACPRCATSPIRWGSWSPSFPPKRSRAWVWSSSVLMRVRRSTSPGVGPIDVLMRFPCLRTTEVA